MSPVQILRDETPRAPEAFLARLRRFDPSLLVFWQERRRKWAVEQCVGHHAPTARHSHLCERIFVWLVQGTGGGPMPLGDHVFDRLRAMDLQRQGFGPDKREEFIQRLNDEALELDRKYQAEVADIIRHARRFNRMQFNQAWTLLQRHDLRVNK